MVNKITLIGRLGQDPEIRHLENGTSIAKLNVATSDNYKDKNGEWQERTEWHTVIAWRHLAERAEKYLSKGSLVYVEGKLSTRKWQDSGGKDRWSTEVIANNLRTLERKESTGASNAEQTNISEPKAETGTPTVEDGGDLPF